MPAALRITAYQHFSWVSKLTVEIYSRRPHGGGCRLATIHTCTDSKLLDIVYVLQWGQRATLQLLWKMASCCVTYLSYIVDMTLSFRPRCFPLFPSRFRLDVGRYCCDDSYVSESALQQRGPMRTKTTAIIKQPLQTNVVHCAFGPSFQRDVGD